jgi:hypothetical protein
MSGLLPESVMMQGMMRTALIVTVLAMAALPAEAQQTLRELAKTEKRIALDIRRDFKPVTLKDLVASSDAIVRIKLEDPIVELSVDEREIHSHSRGRVIEALRVKSSAPQLPDNLVVSKPGGTMTIDGSLVEAVEKDFPPLAAGEYILFVQRSPNGTYALPHGAQSAFRVTGNTVQQISKLAGSLGEKGPMPLDAFTLEVNRL